MSDTLLGVNGLGWFIILLCVLGTIYYSIENHHRRKTWEAYYDVCKITKEKPKEPFTKSEDENEEDEVEQ